MAIAVGERSVNGAAHVVSERYRLIKAVLARPLCASRREAGVTAVEMAVVLVIMALVAVSVYPTVRDAMEANQARGAVDQVVNALRLGRQYAIGAGGTYTGATFTRAIYWVTLTGDPSTILVACVAPCPASAPVEPTITTLNTLPGSQVILSGSAVTSGPVKFEWTGSMPAGETAKEVIVQVPRNDGQSDPARVCVSVAGRIVATAVATVDGVLVTAPAACPA
jgi:Tfp pilus assembly protein FimT